MSCWPIVVVEGGERDLVVGQFGAADRVVYSPGGDIEAFYGWLQLTTPD